MVHPLCRYASLVHVNLRKTVQSRFTFSCGRRLRQWHASTWACNFMAEEGPHIGSRVTGYAAVREKAWCAIDREIVYLGQSILKQQHRGCPGDSFKQSCSCKNTRPFPLKPYRIKGTVFLDTVHRRAVWLKLITIYRSHRNTSGKKTVRFSKMFVHFCRSALCHIPEYSDLDKSG